MFKTTLISINNLVFFQPEGPVVSLQKPGFRSKVRTHTIQALLQLGKVSFTDSVLKKSPSMYTPTCSFFWGSFSWSHLPGSCLLIFVVVFNEYLYSASLFFW